MCALSFYDDIWHAMFSVLTVWHVIVLHVIVRLVGWPHENIFS